MINNKMLINDKLEFGFLNDEDKARAKTNFKNILSPQFFQDNLINSFAYNRMFDAYVKGKFDDTTWQWISDLKDRVDAIIDLNLHIYIAYTLQDIICNINKKTNQMELYDYEARREWYMAISNEWNHSIESIQKFLCMLIKLSNNLGNGYTDIYLKNVKPVNEWKDDTRRMLSRWLNAYEHAMTSTYLSILG